MGMIYTSRVVTYSVAMAVSFGGTVALTNPDALIALNPLAPIEFVTEGDIYTIGGEHPTDIVVTGDERRLIARSEPIRFYVQNGFPAPAAISYSVLLTDETGSEILTEPTSPVYSLDEDETASYELEVPGYLDDGMYAYQITAVGSANGKLADSGVELDFAILNGSLYILTNEEWLTFSLANGATGQ